MKPGNRPCGKVLIPAGYMVLEDERDGLLSCLACHLFCKQEEAFLCEEV